MGVSTASLEPWNRSCRLLLGPVSAINMVLSTSLGTSLERLVGSVYQGFAAGDQKVSPPFHRDRGGILSSHHKDTFWSLVGARMVASAIQGQNGPSWRDLDSKTPVASVPRPCSRGQGATRVGRHMVPPVTSRDCTSVQLATAPSLRLPLVAGLEG